MLALFAFRPGLAVIVFVYVRFGREPKVDYDRATSRSRRLISRRRWFRRWFASGRARSERVHRNLFDLIRRGRYKGEHVTTEHSKWGGLRDTTVSDSS